MSTEKWRKLKEEISIWRIGVLPGMVVIGLVIIARLSGSMQLLEWLAFDSFLRMRPVESRDERITIIGINEDDIRSVGNYPIPDKEIAALLRKLQTYNPRVIGLDIVRDLPVEPGHPEIVAAFKEIKNLIAIEKVLPQKINPPPTLPPKQLGFSDQLTDMDGKLRRSLLGTPNPKNLKEYKFALSLRLAEIYLKGENITLENGKYDTHAMRFGNTELPQVSSNYGGYVGIDDGGVQVLLNYRSGRERFRSLSLNNIKSGKFQPEWIRDRVVIIGITASSAKDNINTYALPSLKSAPGQIYGVELQAHSVSQIINAVLEQRPLLNTWVDGWEYLWIFAWGFLGIAFARLIKSPLINLLFVGLTIIILVGISYVLLIFGWWVPVTPAMIVFILNGIGITALYQYDKALRSGISARQIIIERTFTTIHNGPLQTLAKSLKNVRNGDLPPNELLGVLETDLEKLNDELRGIYEYLLQEPLITDSSLYLGTGLILNLQEPIHHILYQVYSHTLERDFPCFKTLKMKVRTFDLIDDRHLNIEQKRGLCRFLEEALCNVGKHATGATKLVVTCSLSEGWYTLSILDNGFGINSSTEGRGTQQFRNLARQLKGKFRRSLLSPKGTLCELSWPVIK